MFRADVSEFVTLIDDHDLILLTEQGRADKPKETAEFSRRSPGKFVLLLGGSINEPKIPS